MPATETNTATSTKTVTVGSADANARLSNRGFTTTSRRSIDPTAAKLRLIIERMHKHVGDRVYDMRLEAEGLFPIASLSPAEPAEPVYTFHITPSTRAARDRIFDGSLDPSLLRGTLAQGRDLARLLDASINLLDGRGLLAAGIERDGNFWRVGETAETRSPAYPILMVNAASAADDRLSDLGWTTATVTFHATGFALAGAYCNDEEVWFVATISEAKDEETGGSVVGLEFRAQNRDAPLVVVEHADDLVTALLIAIDDNL